MLMQETTLNKVISIIAELRKVPEDKIHSESMLFKDLGFDSLTFLEFIVNLEVEFDGEYEQLAQNIEDISVEQICNHIVKKLEELK